jgi:hypothetical protein
MAVLVLLVLMVVLVMVQGVAPRNRMPAPRGPGDRR